MFEILPNFMGTAVHDFWGPYLNFSCKHAFCNAHILRELTRVDDETGLQWAIKLRSHLVRMKEVAELYHKNRGLSTTRYTKSIESDLFATSCRGFRC
jgi:transposase